jgi:hypothetical protein
MKYGIVTTYPASFQNDIDLGDKTWDDVQAWGVKWGILSLKFKDSETIETFTLSEDADSDVIDWKRPAETQIFALDDAGWIDWDREISTQS